MKRSWFIGLATILLLSCPCAIRADDGDVANPFSMSADYQFFWFKKNTLREPVATTGPSSSNTAGGLADPNTQVLIGRDTLDSSSGNGISSEISYAFMPGLTWTLGGFYLFDVGRNQTASSDANGNPLLLRPFTDASNNNPNAGVFVAFPGVLGGTILATSKIDFWGFDSNVLCGIFGDENYCLSGLVGARYLQLYERVSVADQSTLLQDGVAGIGPTGLYAGNTISEYDQFTTRNQFFGGQIGAVFEMRFIERLWVAATGKVAFGVTHEESTIAGLTSAVSPQAGNITVPAGVLATVSNIGQVARDPIAVVPEFDLKVGYDITHQVRAVLGYHVLFWSKVAQSGQQIPPAVSSNEIPTSPTYSNATGMPVPAAGVSSTTFWLQGIQCGLEIKF